jgi:thiol-disulfide isomerase/thioredoxin
MRALIIGLALLALPRTLAYEEEEDVVVLEGKDGRNDFDQFIQSEKLALVEFWAPWCGHCKELTPKWSEAARRAKKLPHPVRLATATHATTE